MRRIAFAVLAIMTAAAACPVAAAAAPIASHGPTRSKASRSRFVPGRVLVGVDRGTRGTAKRSVRPHGGRVLEFQAPGRFLVVEAPAKPAWADAVRGAPGVLYAEPDYLVTAQDVDDPIAGPHGEYAHLRVPRARHRPARTIGDVGHRARIRAAVRARVLAVDRVGGRLEHARARRRARWYDEQTPPRRGQRDRLARPRHAGVRSGVLTRREPRQCGDLDGSRRAVLDLFASSDPTRRLGFGASLDPATTHVVQVRVLGLKRSASGTWVDLDAVATLE